MVAYKKIFFYDFLISIVTIITILLSCDEMLSIIYLYVVIFSISVHQNIKQLKSMDRYFFKRSGERHKQYIMIEFTKIVERRFWPYAIASMFLVINQNVGMFGAPIESKDRSIIFYLTDWAIGGGVLSNKISVVIFLLIYFILSASLHIPHVYSTYSKRISLLHVSRKDLYAPIIVQIALFSAFTVMGLSLSILIKKIEVHDVNILSIIYLGPSVIFVFMMLFISSSISVFHLIYRLARKGSSLS
ncbi:hypothetical protein [Magnetospira thiophila]